MPFLFLLPMILMCGVWRTAEDEARAFFPARVPAKRLPR